MDKKQILKHYFGYDDFREGQEMLIDSILGGKDTLGIMPTGAGKSLCFQIPALMMDGVTLVISPLISLMKDQVEALNQVGVHAAYLNSSLTASQYYKALEFAREGRYPIIYVAPERLVTEEFLHFALHTKISMIAVDEAHCVSQWGQDFRPSYLRILEFVEKLPARPVLSAFTATATKEVRDDIIDILMLREPTVMTTGFDRPNLYFGVQSPKDKYACLKNYLEMHPGESGVIYCLTRKVVEEVCEKLQREGYPVTRYHAGLSDGERRQNQEDFIYDRSPLMVATNAFGMGIDKSNVRFVVHYNMPKNMESYYQEAGRAGRDGEPAECILLYGGQDVVTNQFFIDNNQDNQELDALTRSLVMERDRERLKKMTYYCFTNECLRDYILRYFGEYGENYCGNCSNCLSQFETVDVTEIARAVIGCVSSSRQRYGTNVIIDTLHGANTAKIRQYRMDENPFYGEMSKVPAYKIRQVMNHLLLNDYLFVTNDEYVIVKMTIKSKEFMENDESIMMKMAKDQERQAKEKSEKKVRKSKAVKEAALTDLDEHLFDKLRALRSEIAKEEKVPPYIVFSDKTLVHMCSVKPGTKAEMLSVSGVGEFKFEKYGERFLECVRAEGKTGEKTEAKSTVKPVEIPAVSDSGDGLGYFGDDDLYFSSDSSEFDDWSLEDALAAWDSGSQGAVNQRPVNQGMVNPELVKQKLVNQEPINPKLAGHQEPSVKADVSKTKKTKISKTDFIMTQELAEQLHYSPQVSLSDFVGQINDLRDDEIMKRLTIKEVEQKLVDDGYFEEKFFNGMKRKKATEAGKEYGIVAEKRLSEKGNEYDVFYYTEKAQREIVEWLLNKAAVHRQS